MIIKTEAGLHQMHNRSKPEKAVITWTPGAHGEMYMRIQVGKRDMQFSIPAKEWKKVSERIKGITSNAVPEQVRQRLPVGSRY